MGGEVSIENPANSVLRVELDIQVAWTLQILKIIFKLFALTVTSLSLRLFKTDRFQAWQRHTNAVMIVYDNCRY